MTDTELLEAVVKAIIAANDCLECQEGVDLLYYMSMSGESKTPEYKVIAEILGKLES